MGNLLKATLMLLGAACVLLLAGGFPLAGAPGVYRGGLMMLLGVVVLIICLWGTWRLARGQVVRLLCGVVCMFLACAGVVAVWRFGALAVAFPGEGAAESAAGVWFGRVGLLCHALVGLMFAGIFGFLTLRFMVRRLWLAALHLCGALILAGAYGDCLAAVTVNMRVPVVADGSAYGAWQPDGHERIQIAVVNFNVLRYDKASSYTLLKHEQGTWQPIGAPEQKGDEIVLGEERWPVDSLRRMPGSEQRFVLLPGTPPRMLLEAQPPPVKEYRATCRITISHPEGDEVREETLRVNEPISCGGYLVYLMNYIQPTRSGEPTEVELEVRRAPGRNIALLGMLGIILSAFGWAFSTREEAAA